MFEDDDLVLAALKAGARGYVLKDADRGALLRAIRAVANGEAPLGEAGARRVLQHFAPPPRDGQPPIRRPAPAPLEELTPREQEVLALIAPGRRNREIAEALVINEKTVRNHISNTLSKLQVADRAQAILRAREAGLGLDQGSPTYIPIRREAAAQPGGSVPREFTALSPPSSIPRPIDAHPSRGDAPGCCLGGLGCRGNG